MDGLQMSGRLRLLKTVVQQGRSERKAEAYFIGTVRS